MTVEVVTVWAPRPMHEKWRQDYLDLLRLQRRTAEQFGHEHSVVSDEQMGDPFDCLLANLPESLMRAMIAGVIARLKLGAHNDLVFVDADCLVARDLAPAFDDDMFDIGLTNRISDKSPINNGAMYVRGSCALACVPFFERALALCGDHWGADQEAISQAAAPVPDQSCVEDRDGLRFGFISMKKYAAVPKTPGKVHDKLPFIVHFKGDTKPWAAEYAERFIL